MANPTITVIDRPTLLLGDNMYHDLTLPKDPKPYRKGTVLGEGGARASATVPGLYVLPIDIDATTDDALVRVIIAGKVAAEQLVFAGNANLETRVPSQGGKTQWEHLRQVNIYAIRSVGELSYPDNM